jgi:hypothetical protein
VHTRSGQATLIAITSAIVLVTIAALSAPVFGYVRLSARGKGGPRTAAIAAAPPNCRAYRVRVNAFTSCAFGYTVFALYTARVNWDATTVPSPIVARDAAARRTYRMACHKSRDKVTCVGPQRLGVSFRQPADCGSTDLALARCATLAGPWCHMDLCFYTPARPRCAAGWTYQPPPAGVAAPGNCSIPFRKAWRAGTAAAQKANATRLVGSVNTFLATRAAGSRGIERCSLVSLVALIAFKVEATNGCKRLFSMASSVYGAHAWTMTQPVGPGLGRACDYVGAEGIPRRDAVAVAEPGSSGAKVLCRALVRSRQWVR